MSTKRKSTAAQRDALVALQAVVAAGDSPLIEVADLGVKERHTVMRVRLRTVDLSTAVGGLELLDEEEVVIVIPPAFPWHVPDANVEHERFVGFAHVLQGSRLCVYLNPAQEWHPDKGIIGFLDDVFTWFEDAAAGRFDASRALFHPVGGVVHRTPGTPVIVVRSLRELRRRTFVSGWLKLRTSDRLDLIDDASSDGDAPILLVALPGPLQYGAGTTIGNLLGRIARLGHPKPGDLAAVLAQAAARGTDGSPLYFMLALPFPTKTGAMDHHLLAGRLPPGAADGLRRAVAQAGALAEVTEADLALDTPIEWCRVSDERESITTRRDTTRPVNALQDADVEIWGCGGLGAWIAEFVVRAGARRVTLCDPFPVTGGLLVRQNYVEDDIGRSKDVALAARLRAIRDDVVVVIRERGIADAVAEGDLPACDLLIDATVNASVGAQLSAAWGTTKNRPVVAKVAIDVATATMGMAVIATPGGKPTVEQVDDYAGTHVAADSQLERFHALWQPPADADEVIPTRGCSVPTFHGSAADLAAISGVLLSLVAGHLRSDNPGVHLAALPHAPGEGPPHVWVRFV